MFVGHCVCYMTLCMCICMLYNFILSSFSQIHSVRTLRAGEHQTFRVKLSNLKKILVVSVSLEESITSNLLLNIIICFCYVSTLCFPVCMFVCVAVLS